MPLQVPEKIDQGYMNYRAHKALELLRSNPSTDFLTEDTGRELVAVSWLIAAQLARIADAQEKAHK
jgi:hypothetical protein